MPGLAQSAARETSPSRRERIAVLSDAAAVAGADGIDHRERQIALVLFQVLQLRTEPGPSSGTGAIHAQRAAHAIVGRRRVGQHALELVDGGACAGAAQFEQLAHVVVRLVGQDLGDRALVERGHVVAARVDGVRKRLV